MLGREGASGRGTLLAASFVDLKASAGLGIEGGLGSDGVPDGKADLTALDAASFEAAAAAISTCQAHLQCCCLLTCTSKCLVCNGHVSRLNGA